MKNIVIGIISVIFIIVIVIFSVGCYSVIAKKEISETEDILVTQKELEKNYSPYGYTIDNANIIINPYKISPLTALILFETEKEVSISLTVVGKDEQSSYHNTFSKGKRHCIPIYGLYPDYDNRVILAYEDYQKEYIIKTEKLPDMFSKNLNINTDQLAFVKDGDYYYALDNNSDVRWFFTKKYFGEIKQLNNGHLLLGSDILLDYNLSQEILEIDLNGKIYHSYYVPNGYFGNYIEDDSRLFVLSHQLLEIDRQNGEILNKIIFDKNNSSSFDIKSLKFRDEENHKNQYNNFFYVNKEEFHIVNGVQFGYNIKTKESKHRIMLVDYKKIDNNYLKYKIKMKKEGNFFIIDGKFNDKDKVFVILDKVFDKKIYEIHNNRCIINSYKLNGKYSIYVKINDIIYQTNYYVIF